MKSIPLQVNDSLDYSNEYLYSYVDKEFRLVKANSLFLQKFELLSDDYIGKPFSEVISLIEYKKILQAGKACLKDPGTVIKIELNIKTASGDENCFQWEVSSLVSENTLEEGIQIIGIDITDRKKSDQQLLYQAVSLDNISDLILFTDKNFIVKSYNKAAEKTYNILHSGIIGKPITDFFRFDTVNDEMFKELLTDLQQKGFWKGKMRFRPGHDHKEIYQQSSVNSVKDGDGTIIGYVFVSQPLKPYDYLSENNLSEVLAGISEGFFVFDKNCNVMMINNAGRKMIELVAGRSVETGQSVLDFLPVDKQKMLRLYVDKTFQGSRSEYESFYITTAKKSFWLNLTYTPVKDKNRNIIGACVIARDISEAKNAEKELDKSQQLFSMFMANTPAMGWIIDDRHTFRYLNKMYKQSFRLTDAAIGKSIYEIFPKHICDSFVENNQRAWSKGTSIETIEEGIGPNGEKQVYQIYKFPLGEEDGIKLLGGVALDITQNIITQENLLRSNERYDYAARATSDALWDWDIKRNILFVGNGFKNIFGHSKTPGSIDERTELIHPEDRERICKSLKKALNGSAVRWQSEYRFQCMDNSYKIILDKGYIIRDENKVAIRIIGAMQDVTEQRTLVQKLSDEEKKRKREIIQAIIDAQEKERSELAYELHDNVNQILSSSKLMLEMGAEATDDNREFVRRSNDYLSEAIRELRRISHNLSPGILKDISLEAAIQDIVDRINSAGKIHISYRKRNYTKSKQVAAGDIQLTILRIAQEQLNNILKHAEATEVILQLFITKNKIALVVKDNGKGFDLSKTKKGLGLHNIFNRVEYYQGSARLDSAPARGCTLKVEIPSEPSGE